MIEVKHDHKLNFPPIIVPQYNQDNDEGPNMVKQTDIEGVLVPLLRFNDTVITFEMVSYMRLTNNVVPSIEVEITDFLELIRVLDQPEHDNILYLQIIPPFDNAYKKIQLSFYIRNTSINGNTVHMYGDYYIPELYDTVMKPYGILSTYDLIDRISNDYSLGFCSNVEGTNDDRYIYNPNRDVRSFLDKEIQFAGEKEHVYVWWIDLWNNINLVDLWKAYTELVSEENLQVWVSDNFKSTDDEEKKPYQQIAAFTNSPAFVSSPFYIQEYTPVLKSSPVTDRNFETFSMNDQEATSTLIQDGDVHNDIFQKYEYGGEVFGDFDYLSQRASRGMLVNKVNSQVIEVISYLPILGLMKGGYVNLWWYDINNMIAESTDQSDISTNADIPEGEDTGDVTSEGSMILNKTVSGQYYIVNIEYTYTGHMNWEVKYTLSRSAEFIQRVQQHEKETFMN